jgi:hypothetical protein
MNKFISFFFLIFASCSSVGDRIADKALEMPAVRKKIETIARACISDTQKGALNIRFTTEKETTDFCVCLIWGFGGYTNFKPLNERNIRLAGERFDYSPEQYVINLAENVQKNYLDLVTTIQNLNGHHSWKNHYDVLYRNNVNYCTKNANYGLSI